MRAHSTALLDAAMATGGAWKYVLAYLYTAAVAILPIPAEIPAMANGVLFGPLAGVAVTWSAALIGAEISFELSRRLGRPLLGRFMRPGALEKADRFLVACGASGLLLARLIPTIAFTAINWAAGLTCIRRWTFLWTTAVGILPGAIVFTISGTGLAELYRNRPVLAVGVVVLGGGAVALIVRRWRRLEPGPAGVQPAEPEAGAGPPVS